MTTVAQLETAADAAFAAHLVWRNEYAALKTFKERQALPKVYAVAAVQNADNLRVSISVVVPDNITARRRQHTRMIYRVAGKIVTREAAAAALAAAPLCRSAA